MALKETNPFWGSFSDPQLIPNIEKYKNTLFHTDIPYWGNFGWCNILQKCFQHTRLEIFTVLISAERTRTTPLPNTWQLEKRNNEARKQAGVSTAEYSFCLEARIALRTAAVGRERNRLYIEPKKIHCCFEASEATLLAQLLYISRLILLYSDRLESRQTVKNHHVQWRI